jgi:hypothetical protein
MDTTQTQDDLAVLADLAESRGLQAEAAELRRPAARVLTCSLADWIAGRDPHSKAIAAARALMPR